MTRHTHNPTYHLLVAEQHHLRPVDEATRTTPVFTRYKIRFQEDTTPVFTRYKIRFQEDTTPVFSREAMGLPLPRLCTPLATKSAFKKTRRQTNVR